MAIREEDKKVVDQTSTYNPSGAAVPSLRELWNKYTPSSFDKFPMGAAPNTAAPAQPTAPVGRVGLAVPQSAIDAANRPSHGQPMPPESIPINPNVGYGPKNVPGAIQPKPGVPLLTNQYGGPQTIYASGEEPSGPRGTYTRGGEYSRPIDYSLKDVGSMSPQDKAWYEKVIEARSYLKPNDPRLAQPYGPYVPPTTPRPQGREMSSYESMIADAARKAVERLSAAPQYRTSVGPVSGKSYQVLDRGDQQAREDASRTLGTLMEGVRYGQPSGGEQLRADTERQGFRYAADRAEQDRAAEMERARMAGNTALEAARIGAGSRESVANIGAEKTGKKKSSVNINQLLEAEKSLMEQYEEARLGGNREAAMSIAARVAKIRQAFDDTLGGTEE